MASETSHRLQIGPLAVVAAVNSEGIRFSGVTKDVLEARQGLIDLIKLLVPGFFGGIVTGIVAKWIPYEPPAEPVERSFFNVAHISFGPDETVIFLRSSNPTETFQHFLPYKQL